MRKTRIIRSVIAIAFFCLIENSSAQTQGNPIDELRPGEWYRIPNSKLSAVLPDPVPPGITGPQSIMLAWNSAAYDTTRDRLLVWGGGHADYTGNEVYAFDLRSLAWSRIWGPSANIPTSGRWETYPDGNPSARHTYDGLTYIPTVDRLFASNGSPVWLGNGSIATWLFNLASLTWQRGVDTPADSITSSAAYDPVSKHVFVQGNSVFAEYDPVANTYRRRGVVGPGMWSNPTCAIDPVRRRFVMVGGGKVRVWNLDNWQYSEPRTTGGSAVVGKAAPGFKYDPVRQTFVAWAGGADVYELNPSNWTWTVLPPAPTNTVIPTEPPSQGTFSRFQYVPSKNVYLVVNSINQDVYIYRLSSATGIAAPSRSADLPAPAAPAAPTVPGSLAAVADASSQIALTWKPSVDNPATRYQIERCSPAGCTNFAPVATVAGASFSDISVTASTTYRYRVRAVDGAGLASAYSSIVSVATSAAIVQQTSSGTASFMLTSPISQPAAPFTIGLAFKKGAVRNQPALNIPDQQVVVKKLWNDGSVKHAIASGHIALSSNNPKTIIASDSSAPLSGVSLTTADIRAASPSASVQLGTFGTVQLASLLNAPVRTWISGPEMVEAHYQSPVGSDPTLAVWFHVRLYKNGRVWVRAVAENGYLDINTARKSYVPSVSIGGAVVYNNGGAILNHYAQTRWSAEGWIGSDPQVTPRHDVTYLADTKLVPNYWKRNPSGSAFGSLAQTYRPMAKGNLEVGMGAGGFQESIGLLPKWDALYVTSGDARAYRASLANSSSLNSYPIVWRDSGTQRVARPSDHPSFLIDEGTYVFAAGPLTWEMNHAPSEGYLAYLITGDYWHYETMMFSAALNYFVLNVNRGTGVNKILTAETRGTAWNLRTLSQAVAIAPDGDPVAADYQTLLANNMARWKTVKDGLNGVGIGYLFEYNVDLYAPGTIAPWQQNFVIQTVGMGSDIEPLRDMTAYTEVRDWLYRGAVGILGDDSGYCFTYASAYNVKISSGGNNSPRSWYPDWRTVFVNTHRNAPCGNTLGGVSGGHPSAASTGYWGNLLPAIAYAVDHGAPGAAAAWARLTGASNWRVIESSGFADTPNWGIVPRSTRR